MSSSSCPKKKTVFRFLLQKLRHQVCLEWQESPWTYHHIKTSDNSSPSVYKHILHLSETSWVIWHYHLKTPKWGNMNTEVTSTSRIRIFSVPPHWHKTAYTKYLKEVLWGLITQVCIKALTSPVLLLTVDTIAVQNLNNAKCLSSLCLLHQDKRANLLPQPLKGDSFNCSYLSNSCYLLHCHSLKVLVFAFHQQFQGWQQEGLVKQQQT